MGDVHIRGGIVSQCDVQFSNALPWGDGAPGSNTIDVQTTAMHEVGHWLKLRDQYMPGDSSKVMYGYASENQQKRTLSAGDIAGIRWIYPTGGPSPTPTVTLKLSGLRSGATKLGTSVTVTGKVTPTSLAEGKVTLTAQRKKGATWAALKTAAVTISPTGAYSWKYKPAKKGAYRLQAAIAETEAYAAATTKWLMFTVK